MLTLPSLFTGLCRDPADPVLLSHLLTLQEQGGPEFRPYFAREDATCHQALAALFAQPTTPLRWLTRLAVAQVRTRHGLDGEPPIDGPLLAALADDPLCLRVLSESLITDLAFERDCTRLRRACLLALLIDGAVLPLPAALALQAWNNEYLWEETAEESAAVAELPAAIGAALQAGGLTAAEPALLRWAMYRPLAALPVAETLAAWPTAGVPPVLRALWQRTLLAPREEAVLRAALPTFGEITDPTSVAVRAQYEEHPYPRWQRLMGVKRTVLERNRDHDPAFAWPVAFGQPLQVLVAGCGTGKQPLTVAAANPGAEVCAIDLSAASLAYARRMARELGIDNVQFFQGDLLHLPAWGRRFHHVDCVGVLHHLRDQRAAWQALTAVLHPGGTLNVGVYSAVARLPVAHLRARIAREGLPTTSAAVRAFRARLLREPESAAVLGPLRESFDFYALSMVRDFLFHVHEHPYTIAELEQCATACGLRLLGYRLPHPLCRHVARPAGPPSFAQWRTLELAYSGSLGMLLGTFHRPLAG